MIIYIKPDRLIIALTLTSNYIDISYLINLIW